MVINEEKRQKFMEYAGKRVNNVLHDMQILEPMSRSAAYDFTRQDVDEMFAAMQETLNNVRAEFEKKFEEKARAEKKVFSFGQTPATATIVDAPISATTATIATEPAAAEEIISETVTTATTTDAIAEDTF